MTDKQDALVAGLDGTIALNNGNRSFYDERKCYGDDVNMTVLRVVRSLLASWYAVVDGGMVEPEAQDKLHLIFVSGRKDYAREQTVAWLNDKCGFPPGTYELFMRASDDNRNDADVKEEIYRRDIEPRYNVILVLDDRRRVVQRWRELGLTCFQVAEGDY